MGEGETGTTKTGRGRGDTLLAQKAARQQLVDIAEQGVHLLWNMRYQPHLQLQSPRPFHLLDGLLPPPPSILAHMLKNACSECSSVVVEILNREGLLPLLLHFLQPSTYPTSLVTAAGVFSLPWVDSQNTNTLATGGH